MNCQECRSLVERFLDHALTGFTKRRVNLHLSRCAECRTYFDRRKQNQALAYHALNAALADAHLPEGFADRFRAAHIVPECRFRIPRWLKRAACFALLLSGAAFAATVVVDAVTAKDDDSEGMEGRVAPNAPDLSTLNDALTAPESGGTRSSASVPSTDNQQPTTDFQLKGENAMTKRKAAAAALTAAMAAAPLAAANGDEYQFIVSGELVAVTTGCSSDSSETSSLTSGTLADGVVYGSEFEARYRTMNDSNSCSLRSDKAGLVISFK